GKAVHAGGARQALRHRPRHEHAVALEPEVPVQPGGVVLLDDEKLVAAGLGRTVRPRLAGTAAIALAPVFGELVLCHQTPATPVPSTAFQGSGSRAPLRPPYGRQTPVRWPQRQVSRSPPWLRRTGPSTAGRRHHSRPAAFRGCPARRSGRAPSPG